MSPENKRETEAETPTPLEVSHESVLEPELVHDDQPSAPLPAAHSPAATTSTGAVAGSTGATAGSAGATAKSGAADGDTALTGDTAVDSAAADDTVQVVSPLTRTAQELSRSVSHIPGVASLAPGMKDLVVSATAKVLRRAGGEPTGIDLTQSDDGYRVRIDAHFDDSRSVAAVVDDIFAAVDREVGEPVEIDLRVISRGAAS